MQRACILKIYSPVDNVKNDLVKYFMQHVRNGLIIHMTNSFKNNICKINFTPKIIINLKKSRTAIEIASLYKNNLFMRRSQLSLAICYYFCPSYFLSSDYKITVLFTI